MSHSRPDSWKRFETWCDERGQLAAMHDGSTIASFIRDQRKHGVDDEELAALVAAVGGGFRERGLDDPTTNERVVRELEVSTVVGSKALVASVHELPPILAGDASAGVEVRVASFYGGVAEMFERWVERQANENTRRAYRRDVLDFIAFLELRWPEDASELLRVTVRDVQRWRDGLVKAKRAPKTLLRRVCSLSSFYKYLGGAAAELRLPVNLPNPAHSQFIARSSADPVIETPALTLSQARHLQEMPKGDDAIACRDRAIIDFYLYTGARIATGCTLTMSDFHDVEDNPTLRLQMKGGKTKTMGLHWRAADSIRRYIKKAGLGSGPLFRARANSRNTALGEEAISVPSMFRILRSYLSKLPKAMDGGECRYHPHVLRATTATLLLEKGEDIRKVQELLGHRHVTTTQVYDKRRISTRQSASHDVPI
jgi:site-specific recombinase XerD